MGWHCWSDIYRSLELLRCCCIDETNLPECEAKTVRLERDDAGIGIRCDLCRQWLWNRMAFVIYARIFLFFHFLLDVRRTRQRASGMGEEKSSGIACEYVKAVRKWGCKINGVTFFAFVCLPHWTPGCQRHSASAASHVQLPHQVREEKKSNRQFKQEATLNSSSNNSTVCLCLQIAFDLS